MATTTNVTVTIPVGPKPEHQRWLQECLLSLLDQTIRPKQILLINDQARIDFDVLRAMFPTGLRGRDWPTLDIWATPWLSGVAHAFNYGVALAEHKVVVMLGSDDMLLPRAISDLNETIAKEQDHTGYYWFDVEYSDGETQSAPCNAAATTKEFWNLTGGFPPESAIGACDTMLLSACIARPDLGKHLHNVKSEAPPYYVRRHADTETAKKGDLQNAIFSVRDWHTRNWERPEWTERT